MHLKVVAAILRIDKVKRVERRLAALGITRLTVTRVKGFGEYYDPLRPEAEVGHARIEVYTVEEKVRDIVTAVMDEGWTGLAGDGLVAVLPVEMFYRIRERREAAPHPL